MSANRLKAVVVLRESGHCPTKVCCRGQSGILTEVTIGNVTISIADIAVALVVFVGAMALTRLIQRTLNKQVFPQTSLDPGVRHSLSAGLGYPISNATPWASGSSRE